MWSKIKEKQQQQQKHPSKKQFFKHWMQKNILLQQQVDFGQPAGWWVRFPHGPVLRSILTIKTICFHFFFFDKHNGLVTGVRICLEGKNKRMRMPQKSARPDSHFPHHFAHISVHTKHQSKKRNNTFYIKIIFVAQILRKWSMTKCCLDLLPSARQQWKSCQD